MADKSLATVRMREIWFRSMNCFDSAAERDPTNFFDSGRPVGWDVRFDGFD